MATRMGERRLDDLGRSCSWRDSNSPETFRITWLTLRMFPLKFNY